MSGDEWLRLFENRWKHHLSQRKPGYVTVAHAKGLNVEVLNRFFTMLENLLDTLGIKDMPERFFNLDETGLSLDPKKKCAFYHRCTKNAQNMILPTEGKTMCTPCFFVVMQQEATCHHMSFTKVYQQRFLIHG